MSDQLAQQLAQIVRAIRLGHYRFTVHGARQRVARQIHGHEIEEAVTGGEIIEDYAQHYYGPACLILGWTRAGRPLHIVCSVRTVVDIITVYEPDPNEWETDLRTRRS